MFFYSYPSATIYTSIGGKIAVPQHVHYSYRGHQLRDYSLYEWTGLIDVVLKPKTKLAEEAAGNDNIVNEDVSFLNSVY